MKPGYGEVVVYEHPFVNPYSQEMVSVRCGPAHHSPTSGSATSFLAAALALHLSLPSLTPPTPLPLVYTPTCPCPLLSSEPQVFELRISSPSEVSVLSRGDEYRGLRAANATFLGSSGDHADVEPELMGGNRLYMRVGGGRGDECWRGTCGGAV